MQNQTKRSIDDPGETSQGTARRAVSTSNYIQDNYVPSDRLAIVVRNRVTGETIQRVATAEKIKNPEFQAWLRYKNARGSDVYISQNTLRDDAHTRTKGDIETIRHVYLDLDKSADKSLQKIAESSLVPNPNYVLETSPQKYQVVWKVEGMAISQAETLQRAMAAEFGADRAATDATRVLRLPGFNNKKYEQDFQVRAERRSKQIYTTSDFRFPENEQQHPSHLDCQRAVSRPPTGALSQSERDWAYAQRRLADGITPQQVVEAITHFRQDKPNPNYYARQTVSRAYASTALAHGDSRDAVERVVSQIATHQPNPEAYARQIVSEMIKAQGQKEQDPEQPLDSSRAL